MAAAHLALREPRKLHAKPPPGISIAEFKRAIEDMPRHLAWIAALGYVAQATWAPAVAGDLARRLAWWNLAPHPQRGSGRLLWLLERLLEPENREPRMADLWSRARKAGFATPDGINAPPRNVDISPEGFAELIHGRADLQLSPMIEVELAMETLEDVASDGDEQHWRAPRHRNHATRTRTDGPAGAALSRLQRDRSRRLLGTPATGTSPTRI